LPGFVIPILGDWYGFPIPNETEPSVPTSGGSQAPRVPGAETFLAAVSITVWKLQTFLPVSSSSA
jgi:hypothetical protein